MWVGWGGPPASSGKVVPPWGGPSPCQQLHKTASVITFLFRKKEHPRKASEPQTMEEASTQCLSPSWSHRAAQQEATARSSRQLQPIPKMSLKQSCCSSCLLWSIMTDSIRKSPASSPTPLPLRSKPTPSLVFSEDRGLVIGLLARCPCGCLLIWLPLCE